jgi:two-component system phosphate regulon sensor histidine kinase PhoR
MLHEGKRLTVLINDFLDLQRLEAGQVEVSIAPVDMCTAVRRALEVLGHDAEHPMQLDLAPDLPRVLADADRLQQVLLNLLSNARKYSPDGGAITLAAKCGPGDTLEVTIADRGLGLPAEALPKLFNSFYRVENADRRTIKGTGLGLAIVKNLVEAHGGRVWAQSHGLGARPERGRGLPASMGPEVG